MSIITKKFPLVLTVFAQMLFAVFACFAQNIETRIKIISTDQPVLQVESSFLDGKTARNFSFVENLADARNLSERIKNLRFFDSQKREIAYKKLAAGEFLTEAEAASFAYQIKLEIPQNVFTAAHISWLSERHGIIQLKDLLPEFTKTHSVQIKFDLPAGWNISTTEKQISENTFFVENQNDAIFLIGSGWRESRLVAGETVVNLSIYGTWHFSDIEAQQSAEAILNNYQKIFGAIPQKKISVFLLPFPRETGLERWRAETRGSNLLILSAPTTFKTAAIQRLNEQLRHEFFHLWMPNSLNLTGNYAWFYEGFAQYAALKAGVELNQIRFDDFLGTLSQAYDLTIRRSEPIALWEAAKFRWNGENSSVYAKGLIVAFLCDVALLRLGKSDINKIFRQIYQKHRFPNQIQDGNKAILDILESYPALIPIVEKHIKNANKLNWEKDFASAGIERTDAGIKVKAKPNGRERDLLNKLGYNNWRKLLRKRK